MKHTWSAFDRNRPEIWRRSSREGRPVAVVEVWARSVKCAPAREKMHTGTKVYKYIPDIYTMAYYIYTWYIILYLVYSYSQVCGEVYIGIPGRFLYVPYW